MKRIVKFFSAVIVLAAGIAVVWAVKHEVIPFKDLWSSASDIAPALSPDGRYLVFQSNRDNEDRFSLFGSFVKPGGSLTQPAKIILDESATFEGQPYFSGRDGIIYYAAVSRANIRQDGKRIESDIYASRWLQGRWGEPVRSPAPINTFKSEVTPCISADGKALYFASNRPGGYGGLDIYVAQRKNGKWLKPKNLGPNINSAANEIFPRIHADNRTLYFSSNAKDSSGGFDVFVARKMGKAWDKRKNVGHPVNSHTNDFLNGIPANAAYVLVSRGEIDAEKIFKVTPTPDSLMPTPLATVRILVLDKETRQPVPVKIQFKKVKSTKVFATKTYRPRNRAPVNVEALTQGLARGEMNAKSYFEQAGLDMFLEADTKYSVFIESPNYLFVDQELELKGKKDFYQKFFYMLRLRKGVRLPLRNVLFKSRKAKLTKSSKKNLAPIANFLKRHQNLLIELAGHTAKGRGSEKRNKKLSKKRAKAIAKHLVKLGVAKKRLSTRGYGSKRPVAPNNSKVNMAKNRRVEFVIKDVL